MPVLGMVVLDLCLPPFHGHRASAQSPYGDSSRVHPFLIITILHGCALLDQADKLGAPSRMRQRQTFRCRILRQYRNINLFPVPVRPLGVRLGPTNPRLIYIVRGTLALTVTRILTVLRSYYRQDSHRYRVHPSSRKSFFPASAPAYHFLLRSLKYR